MVMSCAESLYNKAGSGVGADMMDGVMNGAELLTAALQRHGVEWMATLCGHGLDPLFQAARKSGIRLVDTRNEQTAAYIAGRMRIAGGEASIVFTREAIDEVHRFSNGIPRTISVICDNALVSGFASGTKPITPERLQPVIERLAQG